MDFAAPPPARSAPSTDSPRRLRATSARPVRIVQLMLVTCLLIAALAGGGVGLPVQSALAVILLAAAALLGMAWLYGLGVTVFASPLAWLGVVAFTGLAGWVAISATWSIAPAQSWGAFVTAIAALTAVVVGAATGSSLAGARARVCGTLTLVGAIAMLYAAAGRVAPGVSLLGLVDFASLGATGRLQAPLGSTDGLALLASITTLAATAVAIDPGRRALGRAAGLATAALALFVLALTGAPSGWVALALGAVVLLILAPQRGRITGVLGGAALAAALPVGVALYQGLNAGRGAGDRALVALALVTAIAGLLVVGDGMRRGTLRAPSFTPHARVATLAGLGVAGLIAVVVAIAVSDGGLGGTLDGLTGPRNVAAIDAPAGSRWPLWGEAAGAWSAHPVRGWGAGTFPEVHRLYRVDDRPAGSPRSMPLQWLAETGLVGLGLAGVGALALVLAAVGRVRREGAGASDRAAGATLVAVGVAWLAHGLFAADFSTLGLALPALVALGVAASRPGVSRPRTAGPFTRGLALAGILAVALVAGVAVTLPGLAASQMTAARETLRAAGEDPGQLAVANSQAALAARLNPVASEPELIASRIAEARAKPDEARRFALQAIDRAPDDARAWRQLLRIELGTNRLLDVPAIVRRMLELDPRGAAAADVAGQAQTALTAPADSATATGAPLPQAVPLSPP